MALLEVPTPQQPLPLPELRVHGALGVCMGEVAVTLRLMPKSPEVNLTHLEAAIKKRIKVHSISREPIAFGLEALRVVAVVPDEAGGTEPLERELVSMPGVGNVQVIGLTRLL